MRSVRIIALSLLPLVLICSRAQAELQLASPFTDHMVLQREQAVPVWGRGDAGSTVEVRFGGQSKNAVVGADGKWSLKLDPLTASKEGRALQVTQGAAVLNLTDVLVGEVWLCSGQSNMEFSLSKSVKSWAGVINEEAEIAAANYPHIRMFTGAGIRAETPQDRVPGEWLVCTPQTAPAFSAIGYFFARDLQKELDVPVGILSLSVGASCAQAWIRREAMEPIAELKAQLDRFDQQLAQFKAAAANPPQPMPEQPAEGQGRRGGRGRGGARSPIQDQHNPTVLYNGMIAPVVPYAIRGVLWYQGESITNPKEIFPLWNKTLVTDWRKLWGSELPFYVCQLAALENNSNNPQVRAWQEEILQLPSTGMAVTIDIGNKTDVHPHNKQDVGARLVKIALANVYGKKIEFTGPRLERMSVDGDAARLHFSHSAGMMGKGGELKTFEVAGADGQFVPAQAQVEGDTIVVRAAEVRTPQSVRYAWSNYPEGANLVNAAGLPAAPFRAELAK